MLNQFVSKSKTFCDLRSYHHYIEETKTAIDQLFVHYEVLDTLGLINISDLGDKEQYYYKNK